MDKICRRILNGVGFVPNAVVAYGAANFSSSSRGHASGPVKKLFRELKKRCIARLVNEHNTSAVSYLIDGGNFAVCICSLVHGIYYV